MEHAPCDVVFVQHEQRVGASVRFLYAVSEDAPDDLLETIADYQDKLDEVCRVPVESMIVRTDDPVDGLSWELESADLVTLSTVTHRRLPDLVIEQRSDRIAAAIENQYCWFTRNRRGADRSSVRSSAGSCSTDGLSAAAPRGRIRPSALGLGRPRTVVSEREIRNG